MALKELIPWKKSDRDLTVRRNGEDLFEGFCNEMDRLFDGFLAPMTQRTSLLDRAFGSFVPSVDIAETDKEVKVIAELPGMDEKEVEVTLVDGALQIRGEKREEHEENKRDYLRSEVRYGTFERSITLPAGIDPDKAKASFKKGVLKITLPKTAEAQSRRRTIPVES
jgi:HSP20 family protein